MPDRVVPAAFEHIGETDKIAVDIRPWVLYRIAYPGLRSEIDHAVEMLRSEEFRQGLPVGYVHLNEAEGGTAEPPESRAFEGHRVIVVHVVDSDNAVSPFEQPFREREANESRRSRYQYLHIPESISKSQRQPHAERAAVRIDR